MRKTKGQKITIEYRPSSDAKRNAVLAVLCEILQTAVAFLCLELATLWMLADVFEELTISFRYIFQMNVAFFLLIIAAKIADAFVQQHRAALWGKYILPFACAVGILWYGWRNRDNLLLGGGAVVSSVLRKINIYYGTSYLVLQQDVDFLETALIYIFFILFLLVLTQALAMRRRIFLIIPPVLVLVLEMAVGRTPQTKGTLLLFTGVLLLGWGGWEQRDAARSTSSPKISDHLKGLIFPTLLILAVTACMSFLSSPAAELAANGRQVQVYQAKLESQISRLFENARLNNQSMVTNRAPEYTYEEVFTVSVTKLPAEDLYLRGFYGTDYQNGIWSDTTAEFDAVYAETDYSDTNIANIAGYSNRSQAYTLTIQYTNFDTTTVFVPYLLSSDSLENCTVTGDYVVRKSRENTEISCKYRSTDVVELVAYLDAADLAAESAQQWYADYVMEHYLDVPETVTSAKTLADAIVLADAVEDESMVVSVDEGAAISVSSAVLFELLESASEEDASPNTINSARIVAAEVVQAYLQQWTYSQQLNKDTNGKDVIEYFLSESHTGYCVHYATAAALILREMGVPARYVSGYRVNVEDFALNGSVWTASVSDDQAHAWVEVYLEGFGWVPFEVSPGNGENGQVQSEGTNSSDTTLSEQGSTDNSDSESEDRNDSYLDSSDSENQETAFDYSETEEDRSQESPENSEDQESIELENQRTEAVNLPDVLTVDEQENSEAIAEQKSRLRILRIVGIVLLVIVLITVLFRTLYRTAVRRQEKWRTVLRRNLKNRRNRRVITSINTKIYRMLRRKAGHRLHRPTDPEYGKLLAEFFPQVDTPGWEHYVEIVQKAAFSQEEMSDEEAEFCYQVYQKIQ